MFIFHHLKHWLEKWETAIVLRKFEKATKNGKECYVHICFDETIHYLYAHNYWVEQYKGNLYFIAF